MVEGGGLQGLLPAGQGSTAFVEQILAVVYVHVIRQVPAVQVVHVLEGAPDSVHRQSADLPVLQQRRENRRDSTGAVLSEVVARWCATTVPGSRQGRKLRKFRSSCSSTRVDVSVIMQRQGPAFPGDSGRCLRFVRSSTSS